MVPCFNFSFFFIIPAYPSSVSLFTYTSLLSWTILHFSGESFSKKSLYTGICWWIGIIYLAFVWRSFNISSLTLLWREPHIFHVVKNVSKDCMRINMYLILILKSPLPKMSFIRISVLRSNGKYFFLSSMGFFLIRTKVYWV